MKGVTATDGFRCLEIAVGFSNAVQKYATDRYGKTHTPLFAQIIDFDIMSIPAHKNLNEWRERTRNWAEDKNYTYWHKQISNLEKYTYSQLEADAGTIGLMFALSDETGDLSHEKAAREYIAYHTEHCANSRTGFFAWGSHMGYDMVRGEVSGHLRHELEWGAPWEELWAVDPRAVKREIEAVLKYHVTDKKTMAFDRHARWEDGLPERDCAAIIGYIGRYAKAFAFLFSKTDEHKYLEWSWNLVLSAVSKTFDDKERPWRKYPAGNWTANAQRAEPLLEKQHFINADGMALFAQDFLEAYGYSGENRMLGLALAFLDTAFEDTGGFGFNCYESAGGTGWGGRAAVLAYKLTGMQKYLDMARAAFSCFKKSALPRVTTAAMMAYNLRFLTDMYLISADNYYLSEAYAYADECEKRFVHESGLMLGTAGLMRDGFYDAIQGSGDLAQAFFELYRAQKSKISTPVLQSRDDIEIDFPQPEKFVDGDAVFEIEAEIKTTVRVKKCVLRVIFDNKIAFEYDDRNPVVKAQKYVFKVDPTLHQQNGEPFDGQIDLAVEVETENGWAFSPWRHVYCRLCAGGTGFVSSKPLGVRAEFEESGRITRIRAEYCDNPPDGAAGRYFYRTSGRTGELSIAYGDIDLERIDASELFIWGLSDGAWRVVPAETEAGYITARGLPAGLYAFGGKPRAKQVYSGHHAEGMGVTAADLRGNGKLELLFHLCGNSAVSFRYDAPGDGKVVDVFDIKRPYMPTGCFGAPAFAVIDGRRTVVFGSADGGVRAFTPDAELIWEHMTGGELWSGIALYQHEFETLIAVCANDDTLHIFDGAGKQLAEYSGVNGRATPVFLDGGRVLLPTRGNGLAIFHKNGSCETIFRADTLLTSAAYACGRIYIGGADGKLFCLSENGDIYWQHSICGSPDTLNGINETILCDVNGDGKPEVFVSCRDGVLYCLSDEGRMLWHFDTGEREVGASIAAMVQPAFADLNCDGKPEIILCSHTQHCYVLDGGGQKLWQFKANFWYNHEPVIADVDGDGFLEIFFVSPTLRGVYCLETGAPCEKWAAPWPVSRGNLRRTGYNG